MLINKNSTIATDAYRKGETDRNEGNALMVFLTERCMPFTGVSGELLGVALVLGCFVAYVCWFYHERRTFMKASKAYREERKHLKSTRTGVEIAITFSSGGTSESEAGSQQIPGETPLKMIKSREHLDRDGTREGGEETPAEDTIPSNPSTRAEGFTATEQNDGVGTCTRESTSSGNTIAQTKSRKDSISTQRTRVKEVGISKARGHAPLHAQRERYIIPHHPPTMPGDGRTQRVFFFDLFKISAGMSAAVLINMLVIAQLLLFSLERSNGNREQMAVEIGGAMPPSKPVLGIPPTPSHVDEGFTNPAHGAVSLKWAINATDSKHSLVGADGNGGGGEEPETAVTISDTASTNHLLSPAGEEASDSSGADALRTSVTLLDPTSAQSGPPNRRMNSVGSSEVSSGIFEVTPPHMTGVKGGRSRRLSALRNEVFLPLAASFDGMSWWSAIFISDVLIGVPLAIIGQRALSALASVVLAMAFVRRERRRKKLHHTRDEDASLRLFSRKDEDIIISAASCDSDDSDPPLSNARKLWEHLKCEWFVVPVQRLCQMIVVCGRYNIEEDMDPENPKSEAFWETLRKEYREERQARRRSTRRAERMRRRRDRKACLSDQHMCADSHDDQVAHENRDITSCEKEQRVGAVDGLEMRDPSTSHEAKQPSCVRVCLPPRRSTEVRANRVVSSAYEWLSFGCGLVTLPLRLVLYTSEERKALALVERMGLDVALCGGSAFDDDENTMLENEKGFVIASPIASCYKTGALTEARQSYVYSSEMGRIIGNAGFTSKATCAENVMLLGEGTDTKAGEMPVTVGYGATGQREGGLIAATPASRIEISGRSPTDRGSSYASRSSEKDSSPPSGFFDPKTLKAMAIHASEFGHEEECKPNTGIKDSCLPSITAPPAQPLLHSDSPPTLPFAWQDRDRAHSSSSPRWFPDDLGVEEDITAALAVASRVPRISWLLAQTFAWVVCIIVSRFVVVGITFWSIEVYNTRCSTVRDAVDPYYMCYAHQEAYTLFESTLVDYSDVRGVLVAYLLGEEEKEEVEAEAEAEEKGKKASNRLTATSTTSAPQNILSSPLHLGSSRAHSYLPTPEMVMRAYEVAVWRAHVAAAERDGTELLVKPKRPDLNTKEKGSEETTDPRRIDPSPPASYHGSMTSSPVDGSRWQKGLNPRAKKSDRTTGKKKAKGGVKTDQGPSALSSLPSLVEQERIRLYLSSEQLAPPPLTLSFTMRNPVMAIAYIFQRLADRMPCDIRQWVLGGGMRIVADLFSLALVDTFNRYG